MRTPIALALTLSCLLAGTAARAQGGIQSYEKISDSSGGSIPIAGGDHFGRAVDRLGDFDGDGIPDLVVGAPHDFHPVLPAFEGSVWILLMNADGSVRDTHEITPFDGGYTWPGPGVPGFGSSVASLGDIDGNGTEDIAVGSEDGMVRILRMGPNGAVLFKTGFSAVPFGASPSFGTALEGNFDLEGDGLLELAVGDPEYVVGGAAVGAVFLYTVLPTGAFVLVRIVTEGMGFEGDLDDGDRFGRSLARLGDLDGNGVTEIAVGASHDDDGGTDEGAVWVLFMDELGDVEDESKISQTTGSMPGLPSKKRFGRTLGRIGDFDGDGTPDLLVGADPWPSPSDPRFWMVFLRPNGTMGSYVTCEASEVGSQDEGFPVALASLDLDGDSRPEIAVGASEADGADPECGAVYTLALEGVPTATLHPFGCEQNPHGSLVPTKPPVIGRSLGVALDNPLGSQHPGSLSVLAISLAVFGGASPCNGLPAAGWSMDPAEPFGYLHLVPDVLISIVNGKPWGGAGSPVEFIVPVPHDESLLGLHVYLQGAIVDPLPPGPFVGLSQALDAKLGV